MRAIGEPRKRKGPSKEERERKEREKESHAEVTQIGINGLLARCERQDEQLARMRRLAADTIEEIEAAMIEAGNKHADTCDKQRHEPCSCGFASLVKARRIASSMSAV